MLVIASMIAVSIGGALVYANGILPGVRSAGVALGGRSETQAAQTLSKWSTITLYEGQRAWDVDAASLGITLDVNATARAAYQKGRSNLLDGLPGILSRVNVAPVVSVDYVAAEAGLRQFAPQVDQAAVNAGVRLVNGRVEATPPINGRGLNVDATLAKLRENPGEALADGMLELTMGTIRPAVTDASPMVAQATQLLSSLFDIRIYDPVTGDSVYWSLKPEQWGSWLTAAPDSTSPTGLSLIANPDPVRDYLNTQAANVLDASRFLKVDEGLDSVQKAIAQGRTSAYARVYHKDTQHTVRPGETITTIAWDYGEPYLYIQQANGGLGAVSVGQTITIPSPDNFMPFPVVPDKRIVVSISQQKASIYENGAVKWQWTVSTGISDSPTWPGIYQIISHEPNAYAGNWNLWMPNFMGVYKPIPGSDFTNGFHGFPTRGSSQLLWTNDLGTRVTYGCILLSNDNAKTLYNWAQEGVVVEIKA